MAKILLFLIFSLIFFNINSGVNSAVANDIVISEIAWMGTKASYRDEWIELYNNTDYKVDLNGWTIKTADGGLEIKLEGFILSKSFFLIERNDDEVIKNIKADLVIGFNSGLSNSGEKIELYSAEGQLIDTVDASAGWPGGNARPDYRTMERVELNKIGESSNWKTNDGVIVIGIDAEDNLIQGTPTNSINTVKGNPNSVLDLSDNNKKQTDYTNIIITEILPNPEGSDKEKEFIEIFNEGKSEIDLKDCFIEDNSVKRYKINQKDFNSTTILPEQYLVLYRVKTNIALNNFDGDFVKFFSPDGDLLDFVSYQEKAKENNSYNWNDKDWEWSETLTPGEQNIIRQTNKAPEVFFSLSKTSGEAPLKIVFDASDTLDADNDTLVYSWNFGNGEKSSADTVEYTYSQAGEYTVTLEVSDGKELVKKTTEVSIKEKKVYSIDIIINEILPNPKGTDIDNEWIELYNKGVDEVSLQGWILDDKEGGSKPYIIAENIKILPKSFLALKRQDTKIAINNNGDEIRLYQPDKNILDTVIFNESAKENNSFNLRDDGSWAWSEKTTEGAKNIIEISINKEESKSDVDVKKTTPKSSVVSKSIKNADNDPKKQESNKKEDAKIINSLANPEKETSKQENLSLNSSGQSLSASAGSMLNDSKSAMFLMVVAIAGFVGSIGGIVFSKKIS